MRAVVLAGESRVLAPLPDGPWQFPDLVHRLLEAGEHVEPHHSEDEWFDIGMLGEYERAVAEVERRGGWPAFRAR